MKRLSILLLALAFAACGEKEQPGSGPAKQRDALTVVLDYFPNAAHAGIYAAQAAGDFEALRERGRRIARVIL